MLEIGGTNFGNSMPGIQRAGFSASILQARSRPGRVAATNSDPRSTLTTGNEELASNSSIHSVYVDPVDSKH
jgi:hypothetical protein